MMSTGLDKSLAQNRREAIILNLWWPSSETRSRVTRPGVEVPKLIFSIPSFSHFLKFMETPTKNHIHI